MNSGNDVLFLPIVSIIITTYKGLKTLDRAIQSVVDQTYKNIEIIVVDDNGLGTDEQKATKDIVEKYDEIKYIAHETNKSGSAARNTGVKAAKGEYIALLDDDDAFRPCKIEKQLEIIKKEGTGFCYTGHLVHFADGKTKEFLQEQSGDIFKEVLMRHIKAPTSVLLIKRDAYLAIGGFDETFKRHQDWEFLDRLSAENKASVVKEVLMDRYIYKRNSPQDPETFAKYRFYYLEKISRYLKKLPSKDYKRVVSNHYADIAVEFLKKKGCFKAFKYCTKSQKPLYCLRLVIKRIYDAIRDKNI